MLFGKSRSVSWLRRFISGAAAVRAMAGLACTARTGAPVGSNSPFALATSATMTASNIATARERCCA